MYALDRIANLCAAAAIWVSAILLVYMVVHINIEIILRSFFDSSTYSMDEFVGYAVGSMTFLSLAHTFRERKHIRVNILPTYLPDRWAILAEMISIILTFSITLFLTLYIWRALERDFLRGAISPTLSEMPVWIIDAALFTGLVFFLLQLLASFLKTALEGVEPDRMGGD